MKVQCDKCSILSHVHKVGSRHEECPHKSATGYSDGTWRKYPEEIIAPYGSAMKSLMPGIIRCTTCLLEWATTQEDLDSQKFGREHGIGDFTCHSCRGKVTGMKDYDRVNHPRHYTSHPSGVECIAITEHMNFNRGNAVKYIWRADEKGAPIEDLKKARWCIDREISRLEKLEYAATSKELQQRGLMTQCNGCMKLFPSAHVNADSFCLKCRPPTTDLPNNVERGRGNGDTF